METAETVEVTSSSPITVSAAQENCKLAFFDVEKKIGKGQFSEVYRAKHKLNEQQSLALKKVQVFTFSPFHYQSQRKVTYHERFLGTDIVCLT